MITIGKQEVRSFFKCNVGKQFSQEDLSTELKIPVSAVSLAVNDMLSDGLLNVSESQGKKGTKHKINLYSFSEPDPGILALIKETDRLRNAYPTMKFWPIEAVLNAMVLVELRKRR